jgi:hypothetical protein
MRKVIFAFTVALVAGLCATAQTNPEIDIETNEVELQVITPAEPVQETEQEVKQREKKMRELNDELAFAKAANSLRRGYFVLVADDIKIGNSGYRHFGLNNQTNFILVQDSDGIVQFALNTGHSGANGLGGWTGKGTVRNKRITYGDNGDVYFEYHLVGVRVDAWIHITLYHNTKRAVATINDGGTITMYGEILPYRDKKHR